jgi:hypothetical protein
MRVWVQVLVLVFVGAAGCAAGEDDALSSARQGIAEVRLDPRALGLSELTRVTIESDRGEVQELPRNPVTGTFDGTVFLQAGAQTLVARAFASAELVGVSNPTPVVIDAGVVTRVVLRILDVAGSPPPVFGPILDSLIYPTTTTAGATAGFAIAVVAPDGAPISYLWRALDCPDSTFATPTEAATAWSNPVPAACTIEIAATASGITLRQSFAIAVFPAGTLTGAADIDTVLVAPPRLALNLPELGCFVTDGVDGSCRGGTPASPVAVGYSSGIVDWGNSTPGTFELTDNCGGRFGRTSGGVDFATGSWLPPVAGGLCILTARAVNGDGVAGTLKVAVLTRSGTPATSQPPSIFVQASPSIFGCSFQSSSSPVSCFMASHAVTLFGQINWLDGIPGSVSVVDDCSGALPTPDAFSFITPWELGFGVCTLTVTATSLQGATSTASAQFQVF